jgi:hypothetical protein
MTKPKTAHTIPSMKMTDIMQFHSKSIVYPGLRDTQSLRRDHHSWSFKVAIMTVVQGGLVEEAVGAGAGAGVGTAGGLAPSVPPVAVGSRRPQSRG